ncbi:TraM recognition site of TraD and TraG [Novipirellula aureliae]|uniref:TraM recognition site of TraD and TraG n=1 Tax=Novipirellula aureliae TaxID=2527966 RepID=A0A5C6DJG1_9BACT|nr:TraM recognition domain-containing protein [Novipirellula aureliae]TWU37513.1 TraM recognition site of TraD and TraG [Novipirellula aureliae]
MSVDPIKLDNPIDHNSVPSEPMSIAFPANPVPNPPIEQIVLLGMYIAAVSGLAMLVVLLAHHNSELALQIGKYQRLSVILFFAFLVFRGLLRETPLYSFVLGSAIFCGSLCATTLTIAAPHAEKAFAAFLMGLFVWNVIEIAIHYTTLDEKVVHQDAERSAKQRDTELSNLFLLVTISSIGFCLMLLTEARLPATFVLSFLILGIAYSKAAIRSNRPLSFIAATVNGYFAYPNADETAPGLIKTTAPNQLLRPISVALLIVAMASVSVCLGDHSIELIRILATAAASILLAVASLAVAVAFTARAVHFPTGKIPYQATVDKLRRSGNANEKESYFWGAVEVDSSPILIHRSLFSEHAHILGSTGSGKTALRLAPIIEQTIGFGDMSLFIIDLKADKLEQLASCYATRDRMKSETGIDVPIKVFTTEQGDLSHVFNPLITDGWKRFSIADRTSVVCETLGLYYGADFGRGHFSAINADVIQACFNANPSAESFAELYETLCDLAGTSSSAIGQMRRTEYTHVAQLLQKLASCNVLNATAARVANKAAIENRINLAEAFQTPGIYYFHLPSTTSPVLAPAIARLVTKFLLIAAKSAKRDKKVQVIIDEFQRMMSESLDNTFQLARSHDINLIIANQSIGDLRAKGDRLINAIETNCAIRQWLSVTSVNDLEMVGKLFGTHKEVHKSETQSRNGTSVQRSLRDAPRITITDLQQISDDPFLSVTKITGVRDGYSKYRGVPFVVRNQFHISGKEYERRRDFVWPTDLPGMMMVEELSLPTIAIKAKKAKPDRPIDNDTDDLADLFV